MNRTSEGTSNQALERTGHTTGFFPRASVSGRVARRSPPALDIYQWKR
jgi:hypothetical protein